MLYESEFAEDVYDMAYIDSSVDDDEIDTAEAGFMHGYLGRWKSF